MVLGDGDGRVTLRNTTDELKVMLLTDDGDGNGDDGEGH